MEKIGNYKIWSYCKQQDRAEVATNHAIRGSEGHEVKTYFELAKKVAELQFRNRDHMFLFRGQKHDYKTTKKNSMLKASIFRLDGLNIPKKNTLIKRFSQLRAAEAELISMYTNDKLLGYERLKRQRIIRWAILQHYEICSTPLLDVTNSLRISASFASSKNDSDQAFLYAFGVPNLSGAVTASSEAGLQVIRLASACPPDAVRPHIQEGYLLGEYPEISDYLDHTNYGYFEMDFGRRLIAKFRFNPKTFWSNKNYPTLPDAALYPKEHSDPLLSIASAVKNKINQEIG